MKFEIPDFFISSFNRKRLITLHSEQDDRLRIKRHCGGANSGQRYALRRHVFLYKWFPIDVYISEGAIERQESPASNIKGKTICRNVRQTIHQVQY